MSSHHTHECNLDCNSTSLPKEKMKNDTFKMTLIFTKQCSFLQNAPLKATQGHWTKPCGECVLSVRKLINRVIFIPENRKSSQFFTSTEHVSRQIPEKKKKEGSAVSWFSCVVSMLVRCKVLTYFTLKNALEHYFTLHKTMSMMYSVHCVMEPCPVGLCPVPWNDFG